MKRYFIYLTTNLINGKKYVGKHYGYKDDSYLGSGKLLLKAIDKYGKENFIREILEFSKNEEENCEKEKYYIALFNACENDMFYNIHEGGSGGNTIKGWTLEEKLKYSKKRSQQLSGQKNPMYGKKRSEEWKRQQSYWAKNIRDNSVYRTPEYKEKMSKIKSGENNGMYGKKHSEESKKKMSEHSKGKNTGCKNGMYGKKGNKALNGKHILMLDDNGRIIKEFNAKTAVLEFLNLKGHVSLDKAIKHNTKYKGYFWKQIDKDKSVETN